MKNLLLILALFYCHTSFRQSELSVDSFETSNQESLENKLVDIKKSEYAFYFRLHFYGQTIDIFSRDNQVFQGTITSSVREYEEIKVEDNYHTQATKLYSAKFQIDSFIASSIAKKIIESGQLSIPSDTSIDFWIRRFLHCESLNFEIKNEGKYISQSFYCPWSQPDSIEYKEVILSNYYLLYQELKLDSIYQKFWTMLPKGKTYSGDGYIMSYKFTDQEEEWWKRDEPRREYLKAIKDTVNNYLNFKLDSIQPTYESKYQVCFSSQLITFGTNGKLKKIWTHPDDKIKMDNGLSWYFAELLEVRKCHRRIKKIFKKVNLSSFDLEYEVHRTLYLDFGYGWKVIDSTIY